MIRSLLLNKLSTFVFIFLALGFSSTLAATTVDIWEKKENPKDQDVSNEEIKIKSPTISGDIEKLTIKINEQEINETENSLIGIFDPEENNFSLNMWSSSDGADIKNVLKRIQKLKLSKFSEDLLFQVLFTNAYPPKANLNSTEFLKIKMNWLIKKRRFKDLEMLLKANPEVGKNARAMKFLVNEYISAADIKSACEKIELLSKDVKNDYLDKFKVYCLIDNDQKNEAQLVYELLKERGLKDQFFENKINFLLGITEKTNQEILDNNLLNFYFSHITNSNFNYVPDDKTDKYIWRYLSSANLIKISDFQNEETILAYEQAAQENSFEKSEVFKIYLMASFNFNQLKNSTEVYKNLPGYKARALIYQSMLLSENIEKKLYLAFLLKDLFKKDKLLNVYSDELPNILQTIDLNEIPERYEELVKESLDKKIATAKQIKFDNDILHRSKVLKHFLENDEKLNRTKKDFKSVYKKIKRNKKYFLSIKDIIVLESLEFDGISIPKDLDFRNLANQLTVPKNLQDIVEQKQTGLVMLKIIEIIGEDDISNLDPETVYFLNRILNKLNLKKIRNNILSEALPVKV
jgi:hypothetical protein